MWHKLAHQVMLIVYAVIPIIGNKPLTTAGTTLEFATSLYK